MVQPVKIGVELKNIEEFYSIKDSQGQAIDFTTADGKQLFRHLRHNCTTYDEVLDRIRIQNRCVTEAQQKLVKQAAAEVIIEHFRKDNDTLQTDLAKERKEKRQLRNTFTKFTAEVGGLLQKIGANSITVGINVLDDLLQKVATADQIEQAYEQLQSKHKNSTNAFGRLNDTYRIHEVLTLDYLKEKGIEDEIVENLRKLYKTQSPRTAIPTFCQFSESGESAVIKRIKGKLHYTDSSKL